MNTIKTQAKPVERQTTGAASVQQADLKQRMVLARLINESYELSEHQRRWGRWTPVVIVWGSFVAGGVFVGACLGIAVFLSR